MDLGAYIRSEVEECLRRLKRLEFGLNVDTAYVYSSEADTSDMEYFRCEVELFALEKEYIEKRLLVLRRWSQV